MVCRRLRPFLRLALGFGLFFVLVRPATAQQYCSSPGYCLKCGPGGGFSDCPGPTDCISLECGLPGQCGACTQDQCNDYSGTCICSDEQTSVPYNTCSNNSCNWCFPVRLEKASPRDKSTV